MSNHAKNRCKLCGVCGVKIVFGGRLQSRFAICEKIEELIKKFSNSEFNIRDERYPTSICFTCKVTLYDRQKGNLSRFLPKMPNFKDIILLKETRTSRSECKCFICQTASSKIHKKTENGRGHKKSAKVIEKTNGLLAASKVHPDNSITKNVDKNDKIQLCKKCLSEISKGKIHVCNTNKSHQNIFETVKSLPEHQKDSLIGVLLKDKATNQGMPLRLKNVELNLKSGGSNTKIVVNPKPQKEAFYSVDELDNFYINSGRVLGCLTTFHISYTNNIQISGLSLQKMEKFTNFLRSTVGKKSVPPYYRRHVSQKAKCLESLYKSDSLEFEIEKSEDKQLRPVVWADAEELLDAVMAQREETGGVKIKLMADGGQGSFKMSMTILPENYDEDENLDFEPSPKKRCLYAEGGSLRKKANLNGVKRLIMLCVAVGIKESYSNLRQLFHLTKVNNIPFKFASDFKVMLLAIGQQTASAMFPCPFCFISLGLMKEGDCGNKNFDNSDSEFTGEKILDVGENCLKLKTFGDLRESYQKFCEAGGDKKMAKNFQSTVNLPLFEEDDQMYVIEKLIIPELHEVQGIVNYMFWSGLVPLLGKENALKFPQKLNLISKHYHGNTFEGNHCRMMIKHAEKLRDKKILGTCPIFHVIPYIETFKSLDKLVSKCFTTKKIDSSYETDLSQLKQNYLATNLPIILKVHVLFEHLQQGLFFLNGSGLGLYSEQAGESIHHEFLLSWNRYKINNINSEKYLPQLKRAVIEFSSKHV